MSKNPYLSPTAVRAALRSLHVHPTRGMGQNFLVDGHALDAIVAAAELSRDDVVVEVGPGLGVLTWELLHRAGRVITVELDKRLADRLREELQVFPPSPYHIVQGDILHIPPKDLFAMVEWQSNTITPAYKVVANLPYAITSPVLRHFLEHAPTPDIMVVLVQWEVAQRIVAQPGDLSMLSHAIQFYALPEIAGRVRAHCFVPQPAVDSAILRLRVRPAPVVDVDDVDAFFRVIKAGFLQPRKKLSNALPIGLAALGTPLQRDVAVAVLTQAGVSPDRRAETVTLEEWATIYYQFKGCLS